MSNSNQFLKSSLTLGLLLTLFTAPAFGASFDFQSIADTGGNTGESAWISTSAPGAFTWTDDGITVKVVLLGSSDCGKSSKYILTSESLDD